MSPIEFHRSDAMAELSSLRYGTAKRLSRTTFWRWCQLVGIDRSQVVWVSSTEMDALRQVARLFAKGFRESDIKQMLRL